MRYSDVVKMFAVIASAYPSEKAFSEAREETVELWADMLSDIPGDAILASLKAHIATNRFPPTIAEIREWGYKLKQEAVMTEQEAWALVRKAINYYDAKAKFDALPKLIQDVIGGHSQLRDWALLDISELPVVQSNFMRSYRAKLQNWKEREAVPVSVLALIKAEHIGELPEGEE